MYLDFTTLYSQPSEHYERILQPPHPPKKNKNKKETNNNNNNRRSIKSYIEIKTENYTTRDNFLITLSKHQVFSTALKGSFMWSNRPPCANQILFLPFLRSELSVENMTSLWTWKSSLDEIFSDSWLNEKVGYVLKKLICFRLHWIVNIKKYPS